MPGPDSVNRRVSGPGTEPGSVSGLVRLKWAICKRGYMAHFKRARLGTELGSVNAVTPPRPKQTDCSVTFIILCVRLGQFSMKCKVVGIFGEKLVNIHFYII